LIKYLETYEKPTDAELPALKALIIKAATEAIDLPDVFQVDQLMDLKVLEHVKSEPVYKLLLIFANDGYKEYLEFYKGNKDAIEKLGLSHEKNLVKLRLITLAILAADQTEAIPYRTIAKALEVDEAEVEKWVVDGKYHSFDYYYYYFLFLIFLLLVISPAIRFKLIEAKLDQQKKLVVASKTTFRVFGDPQWKQLKEKLDAWKTSVTEVLHVGFFLFLLLCLKTTPKKVTHIHLS
jgi:translation initiation factor 3 subunit M